MEKKTHFEVVGGNEEEREKARQELQAFFVEDYPPFIEHKIEKTEENSKIIDEVEKSVDAIITQYGGAPKPILPNSIEILKSVSDASDQKFLGGFHNTVRQKIGVEREESNLHFASTIAHELFHMKSFKSAIVKKDESGYDLYRSGLSLAERKAVDDETLPEIFFDELEEAIVAECSKKYLRGVSEESPFYEEAQAIEILKGWFRKYHENHGNLSEEITRTIDEIRVIPEAIERVKEVLAYSSNENDRAAYTAGMLSRLHKDKEIEWIERYEERQKMYSLLDDLVARSNGLFENREQAFTEFARANFSGRYLPLARKIETILGKGSFRRLAEEFSKKPPENSNSVDI